jgi:hypothetical protein
MRWWWQPARQAPPMGTPGGRHPVAYLARAGYRMHDCGLYVRPDKASGALMEGAQRGEHDCAAEAGREAEAG